MGFGDVTQQEAMQTFHSFMKEMDEQIQHFIDLGASFGYVFNFCMSECRDIETFFDEYTQTMRKDEIDSAMSFFSRYIGEMIIHNYGGSWILYRGAKNDIDNNMPVIMGMMGAEDIPFNPRRTMYMYHIRKQPGMVEQIITTYTEALTQRVNLKGEKMK